MEVPLLRFANMKLFNIRFRYLVLLLSLGFILVPVTAYAEEGVSLQYDDIYSFAEAYPDYHIKKIDTMDVTSLQVSQGEVADDLDTDVVVEYGEDGETLMAVGCGKANVTLESVTGQRATVTVSVKAAPLTVMYLSGQSNMQGINPSFKQRSCDSVACVEGTVYDTAYVLGGDFPFLRKDVENMVPGNLGGLTQTAPNGEELPASIDLLTAAGTGKTGPDSGLGYEWNALTGDKVYVVNAAIGSTSINDWQPGEPCYAAMMKIYKTANQTVDAEVSAGHYKLKKKLFFWMQGEEDTQVSMGVYRKDFLKMLNHIRDKVELDRIGIITTRAYAGFGGKSLYMSGPRAALYGLANSVTDKDIYIATSTQELWVSDEAVKSYFSFVYKSGRFEYPQRKNAKQKKLPTRMSQVMGKDGHFCQIGHNENGITAALGMYNIIYGGNTISLTFRDSEGEAVTELELKPSDTVKVIPTVTDVSESKDIQYKLTGVKGSYSVRNGTLKVEKAGKGQLLAIDKETKKTIATLDIKVKKDKKSTKKTTKKTATAKKKAKTTKK